MPTDAEYIGNVLFNQEFGNEFSTFHLWHGVAPDCIALRCGLVLKIVSRIARQAYLVQSSRRCWWTLVD